MSTTTTRIPIDVPGSPTSLVVGRGTASRLGATLVEAARLMRVPVTVTEQ